MTDFAIRPAAAGDRAQWEPLWLAYLVFYESVLPAAHTDLLWSRILDPGHPIECLVAAAPDGRLAGIAQFLPHVDTWEEAMVCYLQDLYVAPEWRGCGVGRALVEAVAGVAGRRGWRFVHWITGEDNAPARLLYDRLTGGPRGFLSYQLGDGSEQPLGPQAS